MKTQILGSAFCFLGLLLLSWDIVQRWNQSDRQLGRHMSEIALVQDIFPQDQIQAFLSRGLDQATTTAKTLTTYIRGRTYLEWYLYFEERNFQPILREAPIMARVLLALYEGMVLEAKEDAKNWETLPLEKQEQYRQLALLFANRQPPTYTLLDRIGLAYESALVFHDFFWDIERQHQLFDKFTDTVFKVIAQTALFPLNSAATEIEPEQLKAMYPSVEVYEYMEQQGHLFDQMRTELMKNYANLFVRFENGNVLDSAPDRRSLIQRISLDDYPYGVFIEQVLPEEKSLFFHHSLKPRRQ